MHMGRGAHPYGAETGSLFVASVDGWAQRPMEVPAPARPSSVNVFETDSEHGLRSTAQEGLPI